MNKDKSDIKDMKNTWTKSNKLEAQPTRVRVKYGIQLENAIAQCLKEHYDYNLVEVGIVADTKKKIDRQWILPDGKVNQVQIKARMGTSGDDILIDVFEPYHGDNHPDTKPGRDYKGQYDTYVCLSNDGKEIRVIDGKRQKELVEELIEEWRGDGCKFSGRCWESSVYKGVQFRYTTDKWSGTPKVLCFIPPSTYKENEIRKYEMKSHFISKGGK